MESSRKRRKEFILPEVEKINEIMLKTVFMPHSLLPELMEEFVPIRETEWWQREQRKQMEAKAKETKAEHTMGATASSALGTQSVPFATGALVPSA